MGKLPMLRLRQIGFAGRSLFCSNRGINGRNRPATRCPADCLRFFVCCAGAVLMAGFAFFGPLLHNPGHLPLEWMLMAVWAALGLAFSRLAARG
jgi:hypothetical protein